MSDYKEQANSLREHADLIETSIELYGPSATRLLVYDLRNAAAAIEALQKDLTTLQKCYEIADTTVDKVAKQLPKRGDWELIDGAEPMRWGCTRCKYLSWETSSYCPRCGAKMNDSNASNASNALNALDNAQDGPIITPCRGCSDYDGYGGCKSKGGCARKLTEVQE